MNINKNNPQENIANSQGVYKNIINHDQVGLNQDIQGRLNIWKSINVINHINIIKDKNYMIICRKTNLTKPNTISWLKQTNKKTIKLTSNRGNFLNLIKDIYENLTVNNLIKTKSSSLRSGPTKMPVLSTAMVVLLGAIRHETKVSRLERKK